MRAGFNTSSHPVRFPAEHFSLGGMDIFYFTLKHGLRIVLHTNCLLFFYLFFDEIHVLCKHNFFGRSNSASTFFDGLLSHPNRQRQTVYTVICNHDTQPRRGGTFSRVLDFSSSPQCRGTNVILGVFLI